MLKRIISCFVAVHWVLLGQSAPASEAADNPVKALIARYSEVEAQLDRAVLYERTIGTAPETTVQRAWFDDAGGLLKVATDRTGAAGRELKEYFPDEPDGNPAAMRMFVLTRDERPLPGGGTRVDEERVYLTRSEDGLLTLRKLNKSAEFQPGQALDMARVKNVISKPAPSPKSKSGDAARRDREFMDAPMKLAQDLRATGTRAQNETPAADAEGAPAEKAAGWAAKATSPDEKWKLHLIPADQEKQTDETFVIIKPKTGEVAVALSGDAAGTFADAARIVWAPDSKRFAFEYKPGVRYRTLQLFQLDGGSWRELDSPESDDAVSAPLRRSLRAQRKKLKLPPDEGGRPIASTCDLGRWIDPATALLLLEEHETFEIKDELEQVGDACFVTLKFAPDGSWKVVRTRLLPDTGTAGLNKAEQEELVKMRKESEEEN